MLEELASVFRRYVVLPKWAAETLALWTVHTYAFELRDVSTYIGLESPEKRCGKTTLLGVLSELVSRPVVAANISASAFFRVIEEVRPTLLIDEADTFLQGNDELRGILNAGYSRKTAYVVRVSPLRNAEFGMRNDGEVRNELDGEGRTANSERKSPEMPRSEYGERRGAIPQSAIRNPHSNRSGLVRYSSWCPKVMAAIGRLPGTLADRCIVVRMQRKTSKEICERLRNLDGAELRQRCARFVADHGKGIAAARPEIPAGLNDRAADIWEPLLAVAEAAGGRWPELARQAAVALSASAQEGSPIGSLLLDIYVIFVNQAAERLFSRELVAGLSQMEERPWRVLLRGKAVTEMWLAQQLRPYGVRPGSIRVGERIGKGYVGAEMAEMFRRYLPRAEVEAFLEEARRMS